MDTNNIDEYSSDPELTDKQKRFCEEYVIDFNASAAALRVGYSESYSKVDVYRLLENPRIQSYLKRLKSELKERSMVSMEMIIAEFSKIGFSNITDYIDSEHSLKELDQLSRDKFYCFHPHYNHFWGDLEQNNQGIQATFKDPD